MTSDFQGFTGAVFSTPIPLKIDGLTQRWSLSYLPWLWSIMHTRSGFSPIEDKIIQFPLVNDSYGGAMPWISIPLRQPQLFWDILKHQLFVTVHCRLNSAERIPIFKRIYPLLKAISVPNWRVVIGFISIAFLRAVIKNNPNFIWLHVGFRF